MGQSLLQNGLVQRGKVSGTTHVPDFEVFDDDGSILYLDAPDRAASADVALVAAKAEHLRIHYRLLTRSEIHGGFRLQNAKDLLRYAGTTVSLGDRLRLLAALEEHGSLPLMECLKAFQEVRPVPGFASLVLHGYVEIDLDGAPIGPELSVRRISR